MKQSSFRIIAGAALGIALVACSSSSSNGNNNAAKSATTAATTGAANVAGSPQAGASGTAAARATAAGASSPAAAASTQKVKLGGTLNVGISRDATNLDSVKSQDVYSAYVQGLVLESLFIGGQDFKVQPNLVEKVDNPDDKTYVFHLVKDVKFQDGTDFNADAVKWNLQRHIDDKSSVRNADVKSITSMETVDPLTLKVSLDAPYAPFLDKLTGGAGYMYSPTTYQKMGADKVANDLTGMGTGPFKFTEWKHDQQITLDKNPAYRLKDENGVQYPYLDRIVFKPIPDENTRETSLKTGDLDFIESPPPKDVKALQSNPDITYKQIPGLGFNFITLETEKDPFNNKLVRQALSYAIDRQVIADTVNFGTVVPFDTEIPGTFPASAPGPYTKRDVAKAKDLLKQAGKTRVAFTYQFSNASPVGQQVGELMKDQAAEAGFDITLQPIEFATEIDNANKGDYQAAGIGWSGSLDPDGYTYNLFKTKAGFNLAHFSSPTVDAALDLGRSTIDPEKRTAIYKQLMATLADEEPFIILNSTVLQQTTRKNVQNFQLGPSRFPYLYKVWKQ